MARWRINRGVHYAGGEKNSDGTFKVKPTAYYGGTEDQDEFTDDRDLTVYNEPGAAPKFTLLDDGPNDELDGLTLDELKALAGDEACDLGQLTRKPKIITALRLHRQYRELVPA